MNKEEIFSKLKEKMTIDGIVQERFYHSLGVAKKAIEINKKHQLGLDEDKVYIAGLLHDCAKLYSKEKQWEIIKANDKELNLEELKDSPVIWHSFAGKYVAKLEYGITDKDILDSIYYHTTGRTNMTTMEKLIFACDFAEEETRVGEIFDKVRKRLDISLDEGVLACLESTIGYLKKKESKIFYLTNEAYNYYVKQVNNGQKN